MVSARARRQKVAYARSRRVQPPRVRPPAGGPIHVEFTPKCLAIDVAASIRSPRVIEAVVQFVSVHGP